MMKQTFLFGILLLFFYTGPLAHAHSLWLNIDDDQPKVEQAVRVEIGWGHKFPKDEVIKEGFLDQVYAVDSKGLKTSLKQISATEFEFVPQAPGAYTILANGRPGFLSKTTNGFKLQSKTGLEDVVSCFRYDIRAKAIVYAGDVVKAPDQAFGDILEIIPLGDPKELGKGETLPVKVLYKGKPLASVEVKATYAGFSDEPHIFALTTKTDAEGLARIKILKKGDWFVNVVHETPYPHPEECDSYKNNYSFTFKVN